MNYWRCQVNLSEFDCTRIVRISLNCLPMENFLFEFWIYNFKYSQWRSATFIVQNKFERNLINYSFRKDLTPLCLTRTENQNGSLVVPSAPSCQVDDELNLSLKSYQKTKLRNVLPYSEPNPSYYITWLLVVRFLVWILKIMTLVWIDYLGVN